MSTIHGKRKVKCESSDKNDTRLLEATLKNKVDGIANILRKGADANAKDRMTGQTALHIAAELGSVDAGKALLSSGADPNVRDSQGQTPLHLAVRTCPPPDPDGVSNAVAAANEIARECFAAFSRLLCEHASTEMNALDGQDQCPLVISLKGRKDKCFIILMELNAKIDVADSKGRQAMHEAAASGFTKAVVMLHRKGADPNCTTSLGVTPLHVAALAGNTGVIAALVGIGADPELTNSGGHKPADLAVQGGFSDIATLLRKTKAKEVTAVEQPQSQRRHGPVFLDTPENPLAIAEQERKDTLAQANGPEYFDMLSTDTFTLLSNLPALPRMPDVPSSDFDPITRFHSAVVVPPPAGSQRPSGSPSSYDSSEGSPGPQRASLSSSATGSLASSVDLLSEPPSHAPPPFVEESCNTPPPPTADPPALDMSTPSLTVSGELFDDVHSDPTLTDGDSSAPTSSSSSPSGSHIGKTPPSTAAQAMAAAAMMAMKKTTSSEDVFGALDASQGPSSSPRSPQRSPQPRSVSPQVPSSAPPSAASDAHPGQALPPRILVAPTLRGRGVTCPPPRDPSQAGPPKPNLNRRSSYAEQAPAMPPREATPTQQRAGNHPPPPGPGGPSLPARGGGGGGENDTVPKRPAMPAKSMHGGSSGAGFGVLPGMSDALKKRGPPSARAPPTGQAPPSGRAPPPGQAPVSARAPPSVAPPSHGGGPPSHGGPPPSHGGPPPSHGGPPPGHGGPPPGHGGPPPSHGGPPPSHGGPPPSHGSGPPSHGGPPPSHGGPPPSHGAPPPSHGGPPPGHGGGPRQPPRGNPRLPPGQPPPPSKAPPPGSGRNPPPPQRAPTLSTLPIGDAPPPSLPPR